MVSARGLQGHTELHRGSGLGECGKENSTGLSLGIWTNLCEAPRTGMAGKKSRKERGEHQSPGKGGQGVYRTELGELQGKLRGDSKVWMGRKI